MMNKNSPVEKILHFWFFEMSAQERFAKNEKVDQRIKEQFLDIYHEVAIEKTARWRETAEGRLAEIIVLDQFSRNMFRDQPQAFAADALALRLAEEAVQVGADQKLPIEQRSFVYMPYMHSEDVAVHKMAVQLFSQPGLEAALKYEILHQKIIDRFSRFPHRNRILGRPSTPEEIEFLKQPNSSF